MPQGTLCKPFCWKKVKLYIIVKTIYATYIAINFPSKPPFLDGVVCGDKQRLPRPYQEDVFKEHFGSVENCDNAKKCYQLEYNVKVV